MPAKPLTVVGVVPVESDARSSFETRVLGPDERGAQRVLLVCPPFQHLRVAPLSTVLLATFLRERGYDCDELHLQFELARIVGRPRYLAAAEGPGGATGELFFAEGLHGVPDDPRAVQQLADRFGTSAERDQARGELQGRFVAQLLARRPDLVGMTTSLNQLMPALWLARVVREHLPTARVVLGGASCTEPMGSQILAAYPQVDLVVSGAGERPLLALARGANPGRRVVESYDPVDLDALPTPDFDRFLDQAGEDAADPQLMLSFESSRGCWWGQKHHCSFCGLNGRQMRFAEKSSGRVVAEVRSLWESYERPLMATDTILSRHHLAEVIPRLGEFEQRPRLVYEVKVNMSQEEVISLRRARAIALQPGVESLSTRLLGLLNKGATVLDNLALLKWCREQRISVVWNQLYGIPGERVEDYDRQVAVMDQIPHFTPPDPPSRIRVDRFSPYFEAYRRFGYERLVPLDRYRWCHPQLTESALFDISFRFHGVGAVAPAAYLGRFRAAVERWRGRHVAGDGLFLDPREGLVRNADGSARRFQPSSVLDRILEVSHDIVSVARVAAHARCERRLLDQLAREGVLYLEGDRLINLAVRTEPPG